MQTSYFGYFGHVWICTSKMIISTWRKFRCFCAYQKWTSSFTSWDITFQTILQFDWPAAFPYVTKQQKYVCQVTKIEEYLNQQYDHAALAHLKNQIMKEVSKERENYRREIKCNSLGAYEVISSLRSQIEILQSEVYFWEMNQKKKNTLIKSLTAPYTLTIEHKEHKTKELKNKSTIHNKNSVNSK